jgi:hypothetical protein
MTGQIAALTDELGLRGRGWRRAEPLPRLRRKTSPITFGQESHFWFSQSHPESPLLNNSLALRLTGLPDASAIQLALDALLARHETLRTSFHLVENEPCAIVGPAQSVEVTHFCLSGEPQFDGALDQLLAEQESRPFDISCEPLFRAALFHLDKTEHVLLLTTHEMAADRESWRVIIPEFASLYEAFSDGHRVTLPGLPRRFVEFANAQRSSLQGLIQARQIKQWKRQLGGKLTSPELPYDYLRPAAPAFDGASETRAIPHSLVDSLDRFSCGEGVPLRTLLLAAYQALLFQYSNDPDFTVGAILPGRYPPDGQTLVGPFSNLLALRARWEGRPGFRELLRQVNETLADVSAGPEIPFERLAADLQPWRPSHDIAPLAAVFSWQDFRKGCPSPNGLNLAVRDLPVRTSKFDLTFVVHDLRGGLQAQVEYKTRLFKPATISRLLADYEILLRNVLAHPDCPVTALPVKT